MQISPGVQRAIGAAALVPAALAVPVTSLFLDQHVDENALPFIALGGSAALGAITGAAMPAIFGDGRSRLAAAALGAGITSLTTVAATAALLFGLGDR